MDCVADTRPPGSTRVEERDQCEIDAAIYFLPSTRMSCVVKDISPRGAKIVIEELIKLPKHIFLLIPVTDEIFETRLCELRWRIGRVAGLRFRS